MVAVMNTVRRRGLLVGCAMAAMLVAVLSLWPPVSDKTVPHLTSDTRQYCLHLLDRVSSLVNIATVPPPPEVVDLSAEAHRMCDHGQTHGGITRLRRALVLLRHPSE